MKSDSKTKYQGVTGANGFGTMAIFLFLTGFTIILFSNINVLTQQHKQIQKVNVSVSANSLKYKLQRLVENLDIAASLSLHGALSDGTAVNTGATQKGVQCARDAKSGGPNACEHKEVPSTFSTSCNSSPTEVGKKICWIVNNLSDHRVEVLFPGDSTLTAAEDLLVDSRLATDGMTSNFSKCQGFDTINNGVVGSCPFRLEMYLWVECAGAVANCGAGTPFGGQKKIAILVRAEKSQGLFGTHKYSVVDVPFGAL